MQDDHFSETAPAGTLPEDLAPEDVTATSDPRNITFGNPAITLVARDGMCDVTFQWTTPASVVVGPLTVHFPVPQADPGTGRTALQVLHDLIRGYIRNHEAGMPPSQVLPSGVTALNGASQAIDLNAPGT